jgi:hypothetical protein
MKRFVCEFNELSQMTTCQVYENSPQGKKYLNKFIKRCAELKKAIKELCAAA